MKGWYYALKMAYNYMNKVISILGSTGSIGTQAIEVARMHNIKIHALAANRNYQMLAKQCKENNVKTVCIYDEKYYNELKVLLDGTGT